MRRTNNSSGPSSSGGRAGSWVAVAVLVVLALVITRSVWWEPLTMLGRKRSRNVKVPLKFDKCVTTRDYLVTTNRSTRITTKKETLELLENTRWDVLKQKLKHSGVAVRGFYHTSTWRKYWADVIEEQMLMMDSSLLDFASLYVNVVGDKGGRDLAKVSHVIDKLPLKHRNRVDTINYNETVGRFVYKRAKGKEQQSMTDNFQISEGEYSTLATMHSYCHAHPKDLVFYLHNKGGCCSRTKSSNKIDPTNDNVCAWREAMNAFIIDYPSVCTAAIVDGNYATCGFELMIDYHTPHYSGNFFWASCAWLKGVKELGVDKRFDSFAAELFLFGKGGAEGEERRLYAQRCGFSVYNCCMDFYLKECTRDRWDWKLLELLQAGVSSSSQEDGRTMFTAKRLQHHLNHDNAPIYASLASTFISNADISGNKQGPRKGECV